MREIAVVFDVDCPTLSRFSDEDQVGLASLHAVFLQTSDVM
jgi:putative methionine-R-sulfoxide reductase with GAF domain